MITMKLRGMEEIDAFLKALPHGSMKAAIAAMAEYMLGNDAHGLRHYPPYKYVSRKSAYGVSFFTDRQRRWFFANLKDGLQIPYNRTNTLKQGWQASVDPYRKTLFNTVSYAKYVMGNETQARQPGKVGWRKMAKVIEDNIVGGMRAATLAVDRWIKAKGK